jgi:ABC-2 type transport system ATP-binding protein
MLEARGLSKAFGAHRALTELNLTVASGEVFCMLGANGAGKTTTINLFLGFLAPTSGVALVDGINPTVDPVNARHRMFYIPEQVALYGELSGLENLQHFAVLSGVQDCSPSRLAHALIEAGLPREAHARHAGHYSKGMRQKVGIALGVLKGAGTLLLDEPTSGLDPTASAEFHALISRERDRGVAVLMATHDLFRAREVGTRIGIMRDGRLERVIAAHAVSALELEATYVEAMSAAVAE